jgi:hypothetical protein
MASRKSIAPVASWMLRISVLILVYLRYSDVLMNLDYDQTDFYYSLAFVLTAFLLFIGGFLKKPFLTILCGVVIAILPVVLIFIADFTFEELIRQFVLISIGVYFVANGNG